MLSEPFTVIIIILCHRVIIILQARGHFPHSFIISDHPVHAYYIHIYTKALILIIVYRAVYTILL